MSYFVVRCMVPNYEDYERIIESNAVQFVPPLWPEEAAAEIALYEEYLANREKISMLRRLYRLFKPKTKNQDLLESALVSAAKDNGWKIKNARIVKEYGVSVVYEIPARDDYEEAPERWDEYVRWLDRQMTKKEEREKRERKEREERFKRQNKITIDGAALVELMKDLMPDLVLEGNNVRRERPKSRKELQTLVCAQLASERGWIRNDPHENNWRYAEIPIKIYKT